jgi:RimJ/RimL family protein N-acetyltransferase
MRVQGEANIIIREAESQDGPALADAIAQINLETEFLDEPGERPPWADCSEAFLRALNRTGDGAYFIAIQDGAIVGYLGAVVPRLTSCRGAIFIGSAGLSMTHRGLGIGTRLFGAIEAWARAHGAWRLELRCDVENHRGLALFHKCGFQIEGRVIRAFRVGNAWRDHYWMGKLLEHDEREVATLVDLSPLGPRRDIKSVRIRPVQSGDGFSLQQFNKTLIEESPVFLMTPADLAADIAQVEETIAEDVRQEGRHVLVATDFEHRIVGVAGVWREPYDRAAHDASCLVHVLRSWSGCSIGRQLADRVEHWASERGLRRLTASLLANNQRGRRFAEARGYRVEVVMQCYARLGERQVDRIRLVRTIC